MVNAAVQRGPRVGQKKELRDSADWRNPLPTVLGACDRPSPRTGVPDPGMIRLSDVDFFLTPEWSCTWVAAGENESVDDERKRVQVVGRCAGLGDAGLVKFVLGFWFLVDAGRCWGNFSMGNKNSEGTT